MPGYKEAPVSKWFMENVIYLPFHSSISDYDMRDMTDRTIEAYH